MEYLLGIILVWAVIFGFVSGAWKEKDIAVAKKKYIESLYALKRAPSNVDIKQRTIVLGRAYGRLTRGKQGHPLFDEFALMQDVNAACAGANAVEQASTSKSKHIKAG